MEGIYIDSSPTLIGRYFTTALKKKTVFVKDLRIIFSLLTVLVNIGIFDYLFVAVSHLIVTSRLSLTFSGFSSLTQL